MSIDPYRPYPQPGAGYRVAAPSTLMSRVYQWMALGLGITGGTALVMQSLPDLELAIVGSPLVWVLMLATVVMAVALQGFAMRMAAPVAFVVFAAYSMLMGVSLAPIFWRYTAGSIGTTFLVSGGMFAAMGIYGTVTRRDLSGWGSFLFMGLIGMMIASVVNWLVFGFNSPLLYWLVTYVGVIVFTGLTAYDTQRIQRMAAAAGPNAPSQLAIQGATILYLDFVNLFVLLLRIFGRNRD